jgi:hypothetical protein
MNENGLSKLESCSAEIARLTQWQKDHDHLCGERQVTIQRALTKNENDHVELKGMIKSISARVWGLILTIAAGVGTVIIALIMKLF